MLNFDEVFSTLTSFMRILLTHTVPERKKQFRQRCKQMMKFSNDKTVLMHLDFQESGVGDYENINY